MGLLVAVGVASGTIATLMPLLVTSLQGSAAMIAAILAASYLLGSVLNVGAGGVADRLGRQFPTIVGFTVAMVLLPIFPLVTSLTVLTGVAVLAIACVSSLWTPTAAMVSDGAAHGAGQGVAVATLNAAWALGASLGALLASRIAEQAGLGTPFLLVGALSATCIVVLLLWRSEA